LPVCVSVLDFFSLGSLFLPLFPRFVLPLEAVFPASRHTAALTGQRFNRNQTPNPHQHQAKEFFRSP
jgi:hypothetical protein